MKIVLILCLVLTCCPSGSVSHWAQLCKDACSLAGYRYTEKEIVAFQARANTRQVGIPKHHTVKFGLVITNIGGGYNNNTGQFTAPVKGVYFFDWTMVVDNGDMFFTELVKNGNIVGYNHCAARRHSFEKSCTATARIELQMGDKVWVRTSSFGSDAHSVWPTFGGHKL